jgi:hypothetical protein
MKPRRKLDLARDEQRLFIICPRMASSPLALSSRGKPAVARTTRSWVDRVPDLSPNSRALRASSGPVPEPSGVPDLFAFAICVIGVISG